MPERKISIPLEEGFRSFQEIFVEFYEAETDEVVQ